MREPRPLLARLRLLEGYEASLRVDHAGAAVAFAEARQLYADIGMEPWAARVDMHWGRILYMHGRLDEGKAIMERGLAVMRAQASAMSYEVVCLLDLASLTAEYLERYDDAVHFHEVALRRCPRAHPGEPPVPPGPPGNDVVGQVVDDAGRPVAGAEVVVHAGLAGNGRYALASMDRRDAFITATAADGSFTVPGKHVSEPVLLVAETDAARSFPIALQPSTGAGLTVSLRPFGSVRGRIERPARSQAAGGAAQAPGGAEWIVFLPVPEAGPLPYHSSLQVPVRSDDTFAVERLPAGRYRVQLSQFEVLPRRQLATRWVPLGALEVTAGDAREVSFAMPSVPAPGDAAASENDAAGGALEVQVRNRFDGVIPHAHLIVFSGGTIPASIAELGARWASGDSLLWFAAVAPEPGQTAVDAGRTGLVHRFTGLPRGDLIACAVPLSENGPYGPDFGYPSYLDAYCVAVSEAELAPRHPGVLEAPPKGRRPGARRRRGRGDGISRSCTDGGRARGAAPRQPAAPSRVMK